MKMKPPEAAIGGSYNNTTITAAALDVAHIDVAGFKAAGWKEAPSAPADKTQNKKPKNAPAASTAPKKKDS